MVHQVTQGHWLVCVGRDHPRRFARKLSWHLFYTKSSRYGRTVAQSVRTDYYRLTFWQRIYTGRYNRFVLLLYFYFLRSTVRWLVGKKCQVSITMKREREMFYLTTHSTHFIYGYMASDIWLRTILIVRKETRCRHIGYSYRLTARFLLYAPSHIQDNTYHGLCYTSHGALAGTRNSSMGPPHEGSIRRPTAPWANALPLSYVPLRSQWIHLL